MNMSYEELFICEDYANQVFEYCKKHNIDITSPMEAREATLSYNAECDFYNQYGCNISDYEDAIIGCIGMIVEQ